MTVKVDEYILQCMSNGTEVASIRSDGRLFWKGREVETDAEFRDMMTGLVLLMGVRYASPLQLDMEV